MVVSEARRRLVAGAAPVVAPGTPTPSPAVDVAGVVGARETACSETGCRNLRTGVGCCTAEHCAGGPWRAGVAAGSRGLSARQRSRLAAVSVGSSAACLVPSLPSWAPWAKPPAKVKYIYCYSIQLVVSSVHKYLHTVTFLHIKVLSCFLNVEKFVFRFLILGPKSWAEKGGLTKFQQK